MKKDASRIQSQACLGYAETKLFLCKKNFYIFLPIFFYFFFPRPAGA